MTMLADTFFMAWMLMTLLTTGAIGAVALWAFRAGQFSRQDHARHLPLQAGIPSDDEPDEEPAGAARSGADGGAGDGRKDAGHA